MALDQLPAEGMKRGSSTADVADHPIEISTNESMEEDGFLSESSTPSVSTISSFVSCPEEAKREEAKRKRADEKRKKELEKRKKEADKKQAKKDAAAQQRLDVKQNRLASRAKNDPDVIIVPYVCAITVEQTKRAEEKNEREMTRQSLWDDQDQTMSKDELRDYYRSIKSKPKGKTPIKETRQFADL